jgi:hypothetical protein
MLLNLSVKVTASAVSDRAQPSGSWTLYAPDAGVKVT